MKRKIFAFFAVLFLLIGLKARAQEQEAPVPPPPALSEAVGTVVHIGDREILVVKRTDLSEKDLELGFDDWMSADHINDIVRLSNVGPEVKAGDHIHYKYAIMTQSIPPLIPVQSYEIVN